MRCAALPLLQNPPPPPLPFPPKLLPHSTPSSIRQRRSIPIVSEKNCIMYHILPPHNHHPTQKVPPPPVFFFFCLAQHKIKHSQRTRSCQRILLLAHSSITSTKRALRSSSSVTYRHTATTIRTPSSVGHGNLIAWVLGSLRDPHELGRCSSQTGVRGSVRPGISSPERSSWQALCGHVGGIVPLHPCFLRLHRLFIDC